MHILSGKIGTLALKIITFVMGTIALSIVANLLTPWVQKHGGIGYDFITSVWAQIVVFALLLAIWTILYSMLKPEPVSASLPAAPPATSISPSTTRPATPDRHDAIPRMRRLLRQTRDIGRALIRGGAHEDRWFQETSDLLVDAYGDKLRAEFMAMHGVRYDALAGMDTPILRRDPSAEAAEGVLRLTQQPTRDVDDSLKNLDGIIDRIESLTLRDNFRFEDYEPTPAQPTHGIPASPPRRA